jgi:hypothetical protein
MLPIIDAGVLITYNNAVIYGVTHDDLRCATCMYYANLSVATYYQYVISMSSASYFALTLACFLSWLD